MFKQVAVLAVLTYFGLVAWTAPVPDVPLATVTLTGGPEKGKVKEGENFVLNCSFTIRYPANNAKPWKTITTFYLDKEELGEYRKAKTTYLDLESRAMHWITAPKLIKGVNVYPLNNPVDAFGSSYQVVVQPLGKKAKDKYDCSATLENDHFTRLRFYSNVLDYS